MPIAALQVYSVEEADGSGGVCRVRCIGGAARTGQVYAAGDARLGLRWIERQGRRESSLGAGRAARVHLAGPAAALLAGGQVLTAVPPGGHALEELEAWLATDPPLGDEPHPMTLSSLAAAGMQDGALPGARRLRWGRVALAAVERRADWAGLHALDRAARQGGRTGLPDPGVRARPGRGPGRAVPGAAGPDRPGTRGGGRAGPGLAGAAQAAHPAPAADQGAAGPDGRGGPPAGRVGRPGRAGRRGVGGGAGPAPLSRGRGPRRGGPPGAPSWAVGRKTRGSGWRWRTGRTTAAR
ncbi:hypothetical protein [Streptomyces sp. CS62]|uniref:hypothetical protein n=1 Tax=Streptomyces sp. CS62 TaxID=3119268 RepID=UPI002F9459BF